MADGELVLLTGLVPTGNDELLEANNTLDELLQGGQLAKRVGSIAKQLHAGVSGGETMGFTWLRIRGYY